MKLSEILKYLRVKKFVGNEDIEVSGIAYDSRMVDEGELFCCDKRFECRWA